MNKVKIREVSTDKYVMQKIHTMSWHLNIFLILRDLSKYEEDNSMYSFCEQLKLNYQLLKTVYS